ncbi:MAG: hypothetical protein QXX94_00145 [Candidatus Bathyarchaeia archaeon]
MQEIKTLENKTVEKNGIKLGIEVNINSENKSLWLTWKYSFNELEHSFPFFIIDINNGLLTLLSDRGSLYRVCNFEVKVSRDEAINIALSVAGDYIRKIGARIARIEATLGLYGDEFGSRGGNFWILYPGWIVCIEFDRIYPDGVSGYEVYLWADTGEVFRNGIRGFIYDSNLEYYYFIGDWSVAISIIVAVFLLLLAIPVVIEKHQ